MPLVAPGQVAQVARLVAQAHLPPVAHPGLPLVAQMGLPVERQERPRYRAAQQDQTQPQTDFLVGQMSHSHPPLLCHYGQNELHEKDQPQHSRPD